MSKSPCKLSSVLTLFAAAAVCILAAVTPGVANGSGATPAESAPDASTPTPAPHLIWQPLDFPVLPPPRVGFALTFDSIDNKALLFGGYNSIAGELNDTWWTGGHEWKQLGNYPIPTERTGASLVYDKARREAVLYGGIHNSEFLGTTFKWTSSGWVQQFPPTSPPPRVDAVMAYDVVRNKAILFGGFYFVDADDYLLNDTWAWDGENWQQQFPTNLPPGRFGAQMVYDRARQNILLFGGGVLGAPLNDTWIWDGMNWIEQHPAHTPPRRADFGMAYDEGRQQVIVWGGQVAGGFSGGVATDTWAWDGQDWTQLPTYVEPPIELALYGQLVYLPELRTTVLIGDLRRKTCSSDVDCTFSEETQVWALTEGYLNYFPVLSR
jgi:hypothetical protein